MSNYFNSKERYVDMQEMLTHIGEVIKVIGVGGGGCNAVNTMIDTGVKDVEFICANTDSQALSRCKAHHLLQLGHALTRGLGAGSKPEIGQRAAMEDREKIAGLLKGTDMLFIAAGMGGGTGTGAAPVIAEIAREANILTVAVVTKPFLFEGEKRSKLAEQGINELKKFVDSIIVIPNEKLLTELDPDISMRDAFKEADGILTGAALGIIEIIKSPGVISLDFADVKTVMQGRSLAMMGSAVSSLKDGRTIDVAERAIKSPLLDDVTLDGAKGVLVNISTAPGSLKMSEYNEINGIIQNYAHPDADFKSGMSEVETMDPSEIKVTIIATGLQDLNSDLHNSFINKVDSSDDKSSEGNDAKTAENTEEVKTSKVFNQDQTNNAIFTTPAFFRRK